jgi:hypothetical protein
MSTPDSTKCDRLKMAVFKLVSIPGLIVKDAMRIAIFTDNEVEDKSMQRKVLQCLPSKGKHHMREIARESTEEDSIIQSLIAVENKKNSDVSLITDDGATCLLKSDGLQEQKSRRMSVLQKRTMEQQTQLMNVLTAGKKFTVIGSNHLTSDNILISAERSLSGKEKECLSMLKKKCV